MMSTACTAISAFATTAIELQKEADILREKNESLKAIDIYNHAIVRYQEDKDYLNMVGALTGRLLSWKHLFYKTEDKLYAIFVKNAAEELLAIAEEYSILDRLYLVHFLKGTSAILWEEFPSAEIEFKKSVELYPFGSAEKGDWMAHLGDAMYRNGKKEEGKGMILKGVSFIQERSSQIDSFLFNVWVSGAYLRLASLLRTDNLEESQSFLNQAKEIIKSDERLIIRKQQLNTLVKNLEDF